MEASRSLGLSYGKTMQKIILPQAIKLMIPSFINQFVITLKDTSILSVIGLVELTQTGERHYRPYLPVWFYVVDCRPHLPDCHYGLNTPIQNV